MPHKKSSLFNMKSKELSEIEEIVKEKKDEFTGQQKTSTLM
jgi:hypothetical protein